MKTLLEESKEESLEALLQEILAVSIYRYIDISYVEIFLEESLEEIQGIAEGILGANSKFLKS